ncbi:flavodoxin domain-containing protein [Sanguibacter antarcticus]|uniref:Menaquinone-dependent protoporphyrinogen oxidase n=1 Tax=Sanguibacter antarcticus TaxID=372484 RepID=A0A2A9E6U1_9MICO|nr:flavodoxin domain-containing protein [Sanguibacter antarcticus]PFG34045.1 menaquinone-dependent protoporphyrinogen oxidase [Sanguibacter antarcticus]
MRVLVSAASKHGSTKEIAGVITKTLDRAGFDCDQIEPADVEDAGHYDAVVVGSAIYMGQWIGEARDLLERIGPQVQGKPVWLFSSGLSESPRTRGSAPPVGSSRLERLQPRGHQHFSGKLDVLQLSLAERAAILAARGTYGDARDMDAVAEWAVNIARTLTAAVPTV